MNDGILVLILLGPPLILVLALGISGINRRMAAFRERLLELLEFSEDSDDKIVDLINKGGLALHEVAAPFLILYLIVVVAMTDGQEVTVLMCFAYIFSFLYLVLKQYSGNQMDSKIGAVEHQLLQYEEEGRELMHVRLCSIMIKTRRMDYKNLAFLRMKAFGSPYALELMRESWSDDEPIIIEMSHRCHEELTTKMSEIHPDQWVGFHDLVEDHIYWRMIAEEMTGDAEPDLLPRLIESDVAPAPLRKFLDLNWKLHQAGLNAYCIVDMKRGVTFEWGELSFVRCPECNGIQPLRAPVQKVVGQIGGKGDWHLEDGVLTVQLWNEQDKKARFAEVDEIEVLPMEKVDWPVAAVLEILSNRELDQLPRITLAQGVELHPNTREIIARFGQAGKVLK